MRFPLCKFTSADGAAKMLEKGCIFITSSMDLNDPFEMRPAWTQEHEDAERNFRHWRNEIAAGMPILIPMKDGTILQGGPMPHLGQEPVIKVENHIGLADAYNRLVMKYLHQMFRILSFVQGVIDTSRKFRASRPEETLMWAHYADMFQGVGVLVDPSKFNSGESGPGRKHGFAVKYSNKRLTLPVWFYEGLKGLPIDKTPEREEELRVALNSLLSTKSRLWKYEREVRMIYRTSKIETDEFMEIPDICPDCRKNGIPFEKCKKHIYRDAVKLTSEAVVGVVFGPDCSIEYVEKILRILAEPRYAHVKKLYRATFGGQEYRLDYMEASPEDIIILQQEHSKNIAMAKGNVTFTKEGLLMAPWAAQKLVNLQPRRKPPEA